MFWSAIILGTMGSFHCIGMCGPIAFMLPVDRSNSFRKISQIATYHLGRLMAHTFIGLFFGLIGKSLYIFGLQQLPVKVENLIICAGKKDALSLSDHGIIVSKIIADKLQLVLGNYVHVPHDKPVLSEKITIIVE